MGELLLRKAVNREGLRRYMHFYWLKRKLHPHFDLASSLARLA